MCLDRTKISFAAGVDQPFNKVVEKKDDSVKSLKKRRESVRL